ncbi:head-tail connector protein [Dyadobacter chenwenxiniae]|uniref:Head-tail connector protein n=1 Tax=Dyadobacter chenwenxiniae TaxID=2906456 RepID=A0A9X1PEW3_9BACT|nr:head-tail connector protein [Dyadobacter chenwenxiniae]MCF0059940.1 head-tail connector protein [Dyadobacter chenwenxiniae]UON85679.1 head-tail connector protein [Dyadobacter chenwenxiniae]
MTTRGLDVLKTPVDGAQEPVTLEELKLHLAIDFDDHDTLLALLLVDAREEVEKYTGLSLIQSNVTARWESLTSAELPYGPVIGAVTGADDYTLEGVSFRRLCAGASSPVEVSYLAGYPIEIPAGLKLAIIKLASDHFTERTGVKVDGNGIQVLPNNWKTVAAKYSRKSWLG